MFYPIEHGIFHNKIRTSSIIPLLSLYLLQQFSIKSTGMRNKIHYCLSFTLIIKASRQEYPQVLRPNIVKTHIVKNE